MKKHPELCAHGRTEMLAYDLEPCVYDLPDGRYVQYFDEMYTYRRPWNMKALDKKVACVFELKNNQLQGSYKRYDYDGDSLRTGNFNDGLRTGRWYVSTWHRNRLRRLPLPFVRWQTHGGTYVIADFTDNELNGVYESRSLAGFLYRSGRFENGHPVGTWFDSYFAFSGDYVHFTLPAHHTSDTLFSRFIWRVEANRPYPIRKSGFEFGWMPYDMDSRLERSVKLTEYTLNPTKYDLFNEFTQGISRHVEHTRKSDFYFARQYQSVDSLIPVVALHFEGRSRKDNRLLYRYVYDSTAHCVLGAQFHENGTVFDTTGYDKQNKVIYRRIYDENGLLFSERRWDEQNVMTEESFLSDGRVQARTKYDRHGYPIAEDILIDDEQSEDIIIEGFLAHPRYASRRNEGYTTYDESDTIIGNRKIYGVDWDKHKTRRSEVYLDLETDELHVITYNRKGDVTHHQIRRQADSTLSVEATGELSHWQVFTDGFSFDVPGKHEEYYYRRGSLPILTYENRPYNGAVSMRVRKGASRYRFAGVAAGKMKVSNRKNDWEYIRSEKDFNNLILSQVGRSVDVAKKVRIKGQFENGLPKGTWHFYDKKGKEIFTLEYVNGLPSGTVRRYDVELRSTRWDRRSKRWDKNYELYEPVTYRRTRYLMREYHLTGGEKDGLSYKFNVNGDTILSESYRDGYLEGPYLRNAPWIHSTGNYDGGRRQGEFVNEERVFVSDKDGGHIELRPHSSFVFEQDSLNGRATFIGEDFKMHTDFTNGSVNGETYYVDDKGRAVKQTVVNGLLLRKEILRNEILSVSFDCQLSDSNTVRQRSMRSFAYDDSPGYRGYRKLAGDGDAEDPPAKSVFTKYYPNDRIARTGHLNYDRYVYKTLSNGNREIDYNSSYKYLKWGLWSYYDYDGHLLYAIDFKDTVVTVSGRTETMLGICTSYDTLGKIVSREFVRSEDETYNCSQEEYYAIREYLPLPDSPGRREGLVKHYFDNGMLMSEGQVVNGLPTGVWKFYTPDGKLHMVGKYKDGLKEGRWLKGDLSDKAYIGEICLDPDDPNIDVRIANLERDKDIEVLIYKVGEQKNKQSYQTGTDSGYDEEIRSDIQLR